MIRIPKLPISSRTRIAMCLVGVTTSVLLVGQPLGIVPDRQRAIIQGRQRLCEAIAVTSTALMSSQATLPAAIAKRQGTETLSATLTGIVSRNPDVQSLGLRDKEGTLLVDIQDHASQWDLKPESSSSESRMLVPIFRGQEEWGMLEMAFVPLHWEGWLGFFSTDLFKLTTSTSLICFTLYRFFLRRMLKQLDPSTAVPRRVRDALDNLAEGLLILDAKDHILLSNQAFSAVLGWEPEKLVGRSASRIGWRNEKGEKPDRASLPWRLALASQQPISNHNLLLADTKGTTRTFSVNATPLIGQEGRYHGVMVTFDDITSIEVHKLELRQAMELAENANRAKSDFLANMSHEIRTPMNAIMGFTEVLRRGMETDPEKQTEYLNTIHASSTHLLNLINDILDLSKIEAGKLELESAPCSPCQIIHDVVNVLRIRAQQNGTKLSWSARGSLPLNILGDPTRLRQVLMNLVGNAVKFTHQGEVEIICEFIDRMNIASIGTAGEAHQDQMRFTVRDTGIGISPEQIHRIFNPFEQADSSTTRKFGGTGLGLSISKRFIEAMGGTIHVESQLGQGSRFIVTIPTGNLTGIPLVTPAEALAHANQAQQAANESTLSIRPGKVLIVDDGDTNRQLLALILKKIGIHVDEAENGQQAVDFLQSNTVDLVLMDMQMPVMDGYHATRTLRQQGFTVPIIALTANAMQGDEQKCLDAGCTSFLSKPVEIDKLHDRLAEFLGTTKTVPIQEQAPSPIHEQAPLPVQEQVLPAVQELLPSKDSQEVTQDISVPIYSTLPSDPEFQAIVQQFLDKLPEKLDVMCQAWEQSNFAELASLAHWLKGAGGTVGFACFHEPARQLEFSAKNQDANAIERALTELVRLAGLVQTAPTAQSEVNLPTGQILPPVVQSDPQVTPTAS